MTRVPMWLRVAMLATAVMNLAGAATFLPAARALREMGGLPADAPPIYLAIISCFILVFGLAYLWIGITGTADRLFVAVAAAGKLSFAGLIVGYWLAGALPAKAPTSAVGDVVFGLAFLYWVLAARRASEPAVGAEARG